MTQRTLTEHALWLTNLGYLAEPNEPRDSVIILTANGPKFVTRELLEDTPVAESLPSILPPPRPEQIASVRAANQAALRQAIKAAAP